MDSFKRIISDIMYSSANHDEFRSRFEGLVIKNSDEKSVVDAVLDLLKNGIEPSYDSLINHRACGYEPSKAIVEQSFLESPAEKDFKFHINQYANHWNRIMLQDQFATIMMTNDNADDVASQMMDICENVIGQQSSNDLVKVGDEIMGVIEETVAASQKAEETGEIDPTQGVKSSRANLQRVIPFWPNSDLIIVAGRPGMGKTSFALTELRDIAMAGVPSLIFSLEMSSRQLIKKILSMGSGVNNTSIRNNQLNADEIGRITGSSIDKYRDLPLYIDDNPNQTIWSLRATAKRAVRKFGVKVIAIDYLQLMSSAKGSGNREQEISQISRGLKILAKELDIPVIALSQLSRAVENRGGDKRPMLADLRESGAIEQDADIVTFTYRPEYYGINSDDQGEAIPVGFAEIIIAKHRNGPLGTAECKFDKKTTEWQDPERTAYEFEARIPSEPDDHSALKNYEPTDDEPF